jgi:hypothetical protein
MLFCLSQRTPEAAEDQYRQQTGTRIEDTMMPQNIRIHLNIAGTVRHIHVSVLPDTGSTSWWKGLSISLIEAPFPYWCVFDC